MSAPKSKRPLIVVIAIVVIAALGGTGIWWSMFRVAPEHAAVDAESRDAQDALDALLGGEAEGAEGAEGAEE